MPPLLPPTLSELVSALSQLPGIGTKSARRHAFHLIEGPPERLQRLKQSLDRVQLELSRCTVCGFFASIETGCPICNRPERHTRELCVVGRIQDVLAIEDAGIFHGRYHVLGGYISPLNRVFPENLRIRELLARIGPETIEEIILAFDANLDADFTAQYLLDALPSSITIHRIAAGIPFGGELEYTDGITLSHAFSLKRPLI